MKTLYLVFVPISLILAAALYLKCGLAAGVVGAGLYALGWAGHKHRSYLRAAAVRPVGYVEEKISAWWSA